MYKVSKKDRNRIVYLYTVEKLPLNKIASKYPFGWYVVRRVLIEAGVEIRRRYQKLKTEIWEQAGTIVELYVDEKRSPRQLAAQFGCSARLIESILKAKGIKPRTLKEARRYRQDKYGYAEHQQVDVKRKRWQPEVTVNRKMSVQEMRDSELTIDEISEITGMSRVDVFQEIQYG